MNDLPVPPEMLAILNASLDPLGIVDADGRYVWVNDVSVKVFGYPREQILGSHFRAHLLPDDGPHTTMAEALAGQPGAAVRRVQCADGSVVVERTELLPMGQGFVLIHATDLTELYDALGRARETEERYRELLEAVRVPMAIWWRADESGQARIRYVSPALCELLGRSAEALVDQSPELWMLPADLRAATTHATDIAPEARFVPLQVRLQRADGEVLTCLLVAAPVTFEGRAAMSAQFVDVSEEVRLRDLAARGEAADLALAVAGGIAHDFDNIFTGLLAYLDFAGDATEDSAPAASHIRSARLAAGRAAVLTRALRDYSSAAGAPSDARRVEVVLLADVVNEAHTIMRAAIARKISMTIEPIDEHVYAQVPSDSLLRMLVNLLVNARDATLERAATADANYEPHIGLSIEARPDAGVATVTVTDNGAGIPSAIVGRVFDAHFTTKGQHGGSGLGLSVARDLARAVGGDLTFASQPGSGTSFSLTLPLAPVPEQATS